MSGAPAIIVANRQRAVKVDTEGLQQFAERALQVCLSVKRRGAGDLAQLEGIGVVLVSDRRIASLHRRFMGVPGPTDVITFQHGEIFVSTETARRQARALRRTTIAELKLYIVHGLLHLHGFDDKSPRDRLQMFAAQERVMRRLV